MRISDWSSDVCSSDLCRSGFSRELLPLPLPLRRQGEGRAPPLRRPAIIPRMDKQPTTPRRALVTGGSGDLGGALCRQLAADGLHVIVHARSEARRVGKECVRTCRSRWSPYTLQKHETQTILMSKEIGT